LKIGSDFVVLVYRKAMKSLQKYVVARVEMTDYPVFRAKGYDCGSGPTDSFCGCLTRHLKGRGMRWDRTGADAIMALIALEQSNTWKSYWNMLKRAAWPRQKIWSHPRANTSGLATFLLTILILHGIIAPLVSIGKDCDEECTNCFSIDKFLFFRLFCPCQVI